MPALKIVLLCMASAIVYGICHDQVTARVCVEYFTVGHAPIFPTESPTLLAFGWGTLATWWVGLILGVLVALAARAGSWPKLDAAHLIRPIACLLIVVAVASVLAGITGYELAEGSGLVLPEPLGTRVPKGHHHGFFADTLAHLAAYVVGILGGAIVCVQALVRRRRVARTARWSDDGIARVDLTAERPVVVVSRWIARTVGVPLLGLLVVLTMGDGIANPLTASQRENLFGVVVVAMFLGVVLGWKWEGVGSLLILGSLVLFAVADEPFLLDIVIVPWLVTGLAYLVCWVGGKEADSAVFRMQRFHQLLFAIAIITLSWFAMMAVHELGHVIGATATGGTVERVVLHPFAISRTDVAPNPYPAVVVWLGPVVGCALPLAVAATFPRRHLFVRNVAWFFAGFCLIANGTYISVGSFDGVGDCGEMLRTGTPPWVLLAFGGVTVPLGLYVWHRLGSVRDFVRNPSMITGRMAWIAFAALVVLAAAGSGLSSR